ncbi:hypothetical protein PRIPAC_83394, partial [Pristionchus pacificus]|uniref:PDZ domain-containing protein n=1 Tax=Pristionchus pacificus TaxID=54126 RepID=A0A2A6BSM2_PRIPA
ITHPVQELTKLVKSQRIEISLLNKESARKDEEIASLKMLIKPPAVAKANGVTEGILQDDKRSDPGPMKLRKVRLHRKDGRLGLGFRGTAIDRVHDGGPAALQGVQRGDQLISVNGVNVEGMSHHDIGSLIEEGKDRNERVKLVVRHNPERLKDVEDEWSE